MSIKNNYLYQLGYQLLNLLIPLITIPYITRVLKANNMGNYSYYFTIISFFMLVGTFGTNIYGVREIARVNNNKKKLINSFERIQSLRHYSLGLVIILTLLINIFIIKSKIFIILIIMIVALIFDITWFYQGIENFKKIAFRSIILKITILIFLFIYVKNENDIYTYTYLMSLSQLFSNLLFWIGLKKIINYRYSNLFSIKYLNLDFKKSFYLFLPQITISTYTILDKFMIGQLTDKKYVSFYSISNKIVIMSMILITSCGSVLMPRISNLYKRGSKNEIIELLENTFNFLTIVSIGIIFGLYGTIDTVVQKYFSSEYISIAFLIKTMSITIIFWTWNNITGNQILIPTKQEGKITKSVIIGSIINLCLNFILIRKFDALGAVISTIFTEFTVTCIQIYYAREYFKFNKGLFFKSILSGLIMLFIINKVESLLLKILVGLIIYITVLIIIKEKTILTYIKKYYLIGRKK